MAVCLVRADRERRIPAAADAGQVRAPRRVNRAATSRKRKRESTRAMSYQAPVTRKAAANTPAATRPGSQRPLSRRPRRPSRVIVPAEDRNDTSRREKKPTPVTRDSAAETQKYKGGYGEEGKTTEGG